MRDKIASKQKEYFVGFAQNFNGEYNLKGIHIIGNFDLPDGTGGRIGSKTFENIQEAIKYANKLKSKLSKDSQTHVAIQERTYTIKNKFVF